MNASLPVSGLPGNATDCTTSTSSNDVLSAGSAAFIVFALLFGCMTQLPGSLVSGDCNRFWRLSPFLCLVESVVIFCRLIVPLFNTLCTLFRRCLPSRLSWHLKSDQRQGSYGLKIKAYATLAERLGNSRKYNFWLKIQREKSAPTIDDITALIEEVANLERGATLRPIVIVPMILQFVKILIVDGGFVKVKLLALVYFFSWFSVESLLLMVYGPKLSEEEMLTAERILLLNVVPTAVPDSVGIKMSNVTEQTESLLLNVVDRTDLPRHRVSFRGGRRSLKAMQGNPGTQVLMTILGIAASLFESFLQNFSAVTNLEEVIPGWVFWLWYIFMYTMFLPYLLDRMISIPLAAVAEWVTGKSIDSMAVCRDLIALRSMILIILYYAILYSEDEVMKPPWLDWLG